MPYRVISDSNTNVKIASSNAGKEFAPEEISAIVLRKLSEDAAKFLNDSVTKAVITGGRLDAAVAGGLAQYHVQLLGAVRQEVSLCC